MIQFKLFSKSVRRDYLNFPVFKEALNLADRLDKQSR